MKTNRILVAVFAALFIFGCGGGGNGGGGACQFDSQDLIDACQTIQSNVGGADLIFAGTITAIGLSPQAWSGYAMTGQMVTYTVDEVLKGTYTGSSIIIYHMLIKGSRQSDTLPGLSATLFAIGSKLIVLAKQDAALASAGADWDNYTTYADVDGRYSAIPYSATNKATISSMISSASAMAMVPHVKGKSAGYTVAKKFNLTGSEADRNSWANLIDQCKAASPKFTELWDTLNASETEVTFNLVRNGEGIFVDSFDDRAVDMEDLEAWFVKADLKGCNYRTGVCQVIGHVLQEYYHAATTGEDFHECHASALAMENEIRKCLKGTAIETQNGHRSLWRGGKEYLVTVYDGKRQLVEITGGGYPGVGEFTTEDVP